MRKFFAPPLVSEVSLRFGHARGKTTLSCFLTLSRRFATPMAFAQMRTPLATGAVVRILYPSSQKEKKTDHKKRSVFFWLGNRDSNPNKQSQSLSCCRYTIPQCRFFNFVKNKQSLPLGVNSLGKQVFVRNILRAPRLAIYRLRGMQSLSCCRYTIPHCF